MRTIGVLFGIGSVLFGLGSLPLFFDNVAAATTASTFFVGSLFFTTAAALQYAESRVVQVGRTASFVQLAGALFFNISTLAATLGTLSTQQEERLVWAPDVYGSIAFLVASTLAWRLVHGEHHGWWQGSVDWWVARVNLLGSVAFGLAAAGAFVLPTTGEPANIRWVNGGTFLGAVCFLVGAALVVVTSVRHRETPAGATA